MVYYFDCFPNCKPPLTFAEVFWCTMYHENIKSKDNVIHVIPWVILTISFIWLAKFWIAGQDCSQVLECSHYNSFQVLFTIIQLNMDQSCVENRWQHDFQAPALCSQPDSENTLHGYKMISGLQPCGKDADNCFKAKQTYDSRRDEHYIISEEKTPWEDSYIKEKCPSCVKLKGLKILC